MPAVVRVSVSVSRVHTSAARKWVRRHRQSSTCARLVWAFLLLVWLSFWPSAPPHPLSNSQNCRRRCLQTLCMYMHVCMHVCTPCVMCYIGTSAAAVPVLFNTPTHVRVHTQLECSQRVPPSPPPHPSGNFDLVFLLLSTPTYARACTHSLSVPNMCPPFPPPAPSLGTLNFVFLLSFVVAARRRGVRRRQPRIR